ncbi:hypothetical protein FGO68_gene14579 [Halteria grandinella]|uniref:CCHC-type domain-containing protein n=1 Tax=Halteria grandinella TaxID=5974 RepID=A0A8J8NSY9_HALGN|nr:hypothetical protein FGO68_gene14579 [Halteria grandinella]
MLHQQLILMQQSKNQVQTENQEKLIGQKLSEQNPGGTQPQEESWGQEPEIPKLLPKSNDWSDNGGSFLFTENKKKQDSKDRKVPVDYISTINTRKNPDLMIGKGKFLKGNFYFSEALQENDEEEGIADEKTESSNIVLVGRNRHKRGDDSQEEDEEVMDDEYSRLSNQQWRYFTHESNPTTKCKNCREYGHRARDCPNETKKENCILCGKEGHDSFTCDAKLCFKCNKVGHVASNCTERNLVRCEKCEMNGHLATRCMKVWQEFQSSSSKSQKRDAHKWLEIRCIECNQIGHLKCTSERRSMRYPVDPSIKQNLDEFIKDKIKDVVTEREEDVEACFDYVNEIKQDKIDVNPYLIPAKHYYDSRYCCYCGLSTEKESKDCHEEENCSLKKNSKFQQMDQVRRRLNNQQRW